MANLNTSCVYSPIPGWAPANSGSFPPQNIMDLLMDDLDTVNGDFCAFDELFNSGSI